MKNVLVLVSCFLTFTLQADLIKFECKSTEVDGVHKFDAKGVAVVDAFNNVEGLITAQVQKAGETQSVQIFEQIKVAGYIRHIEAGKIAPEALDQLILKVENSYLKNVNLILDTKMPMLSNIISIDNFMYRSNCYTSND